MKKKKLKIDKQFILIFSSIFIIFVLLGNFAFNSSENKIDIFDGIKDYSLYLTLNIKSIILSTILIILIFIKMLITNNKNREYKGVEHGSAKWATLDKLSLFRNENKQKNIIISQNIRLNRDFYSKNIKLNRNKNVVVEGSSGTGKTRFYVKPNLMQVYGTYILNDPKQTLFDETSKMFEKHNYNIKVFNLKDLKLSMKYNPILYLNTELDIFEFVTSLIENTKGEGEQSGEAFWINSEKMYLQALIGYILEVHPDSEQNMITLLDYINKSSATENSEGSLDKMFGDLEKISKNSFAVRMYKKFKQGSGKTLQSILISVSARTALFDIQEIRDVLEYDEIDLYSIGNEKTILYVILKDYDRTLNFISSMMYKQLFRILITQADYMKNGRFPRPCQFILDEFATSGKIPDFHTIINNIRSRNITATIMIQDESQLEETYGKKAKSILSACDSNVFLGTASAETAEKKSKELGNTTVNYESGSKSYEKSMIKSYSKSENQTSRALMTNSEVSELSNDKLIYRLRGIEPIIDDKFDISTHENFKYLSDYSDENKNDLFSYIVEKKWIKQENTSSLTEKEIRSNKIKTIPVGDVDK